MSSGRFDTLLNQVQGKIEALNNISNDFNNMPSLDKKRQAVARSKRDFTTMQNNCREMERLIQTMPVRDREFFSSDLSQCQEEIERLSVRFEALDAELQKLIAEEEERIRNGEGLDPELAEATRKLGQSAMSKMNVALGLGNTIIAGQNKQKEMLAEDMQRLDNISNNVDRTQQLADTGLAKAKAMFKRALIQGFCSWAMDVILLGVLIVIIVWRLGYL